ncbi:predicted protein [Uncinocarpus reesii 1704]|uniref:26S proteasome complex subunit SEM1 n=1 Tax=Uncinocarpus reesii (strain UAMH 1704) TaxID=336963 RepID=C4JQT7_UNCRE|nr:uncharacterized protein UREG_03419 [Uncinocarpus reesii 1704]EEP78573.1 predicted protein [Uncinocarpus reesii 1704]
MSSQSAPIRSQTGGQLHDKTANHLKTSNTPLDEDDEFEDFPVEGRLAIVILLQLLIPSLDWPQEDAEALGSTGTNNDHLWEESWDDVDSNEEFSQQLKEELKKVEAVKHQ